MPSLDLSVAAWGEAKNALLFIEETLSLPAAAFDLSHGDGDRALRVAHGLESEASSCGMLSAVALRIAASHLRQALRVAADGLTGRGDLWKAQAALSDLLDLPTPPQTYGA